MKITSNDITEGKMISNEHVFNGNSYDGKNVSPHIAWEDAPKGTEGFALTVYDPDAPTGSGWWHWFVANIPAEYSELKQNLGHEDMFELLDGVTQVTNDFGFHKYGGPCPPKEDKAHRYVFTIYALDTDFIDIPQDASCAKAGFMIKDHILAQAEMTAIFGAKD